MADFSSDMKESETIYDHIDPSDGGKQAVFDDDHLSMEASRSEHHHESSMRLATDLSVVDRRSRRRDRRKRIIDRRGAFGFLPVYFSNDLVHGSWWFVLGSVLATIIPVVPLVDLFYPFWPASDTVKLPLLSDATTFALLIISGFFFTIGSLAFVRATEEPPLRSLFAKVTVHLETDELLAAWLFLLATVPFPILMLVYINNDSQVMVYWGCLAASTMFVVATYFFVLTCYPQENERNFQIAPQLSRFLFSEDNWIHRHLSNDWLASTWLFFYATLVMVVGSAGMMFVEIFDGGDDLEIFDWASCTLDAIIFLIGSAYFCAGSYPRYENNVLSGPEDKPLMFKP